MDKFNGFSQEEINSVEKKINLYVNKPTKMDTMQDLKRNVAGVAAGGISEQKRIGIRRVQDKQNNNNNNHNNYNDVGKKLRKTTVTTSVTSAPTTKTMISSVGKSVNDCSSSDGSTMDNHTLEEVSVDRSMSKSIEEALFFQPMKQLAQQPAKLVSEASDDTLRSVATITNTQTTTEDDCTQTESPQAPFKGVSLKEFEVHRKLIEEQNNQKKRMLCKAIELHSEKTQAETRKIQEIKKELAELDNKLSVDVGILRKQIETASLHYANVEKQYVKIEAQFLKSKMELHQAAEKKELLTEHLCTVIAHNEDRKAEKLSELMLKVGLTPSGDFQNTEVTPSTMQL